jgi:hypothetical protein
VRAYLDEYGILHAFGLNEEGFFNYDPKSATKKTKVNFENSVDIIGFELHQEQGYLIPRGMEKGLAVYRSENGEIKSKEKIEVDEVLQKIYKLAEAGYKQPKGK